MEGALTVAALTAVLEKKEHAIAQLRQENAELRRLLELCAQDRDGPSPHTRTLTLAGSGSFPGPGRAATSTTPSSACATANTYRTTAQ